MRHRWEKAWGRWVWRCEKWEREEVWIWVVFLLGGEAERKKERAWWEQPEATPRNDV
jgi:hypothetical protein